MEPLPPELGPGGSASGPGGCAHATLPSAGHSARAAQKQNACRMIMGDLRKSAQAMLGAKGRRETLPSGVDERDKDAFS
jgi:hypothetical protein